MELLRKMDLSALTHEYGLDGQRLLPWEGLTLPFGGAYCIIRKQTVSMAHVNEPLGEEELFIAISGEGYAHIGEEKILFAKGDIVFIPSGVPHFIDNPFDEDCHIYALWWNRGTAGDYLKQNR